MLLFAAALVGAQPAAAQTSNDDIRTKVGFDQRMNEQVPLDLAFLDETGKPVKLGDYFGKKPVILVLAYFRCPMLCTQVLNGLTKALRDLPFTAGTEFNILTVSFDPRETPDLAAAKKRSYMEAYGRPTADDGWHFLTGKQAEIDKLTSAVGFRYFYDAQGEQFIHAAGIVILTPQGKISRYFRDIVFSTRDLRLGLVEASVDKIGSPTDEVLLYCYHYDPATGKYTASIMNIVRGAGVLSVGVLAALVLWLWWLAPRGGRHAPHAVAKGQESGQAGGEPAPDGASRGTRSVPATRGDGQ